jgi:pimeloyl-ACP methyl ester carboxylesterase/uncharacterized protein (DUF2141 family)
MILAVSFERPSMKHIQASHRFISLILLGGVLALSGCSFTEIYNQTKLVDNLGTIKGMIRVTSDQKGPIIVLRFLDEDGIPVLNRSAIANEKGEYEFPSVPGQYYIAAFIDVNNDGKYQTAEHGNFYGAPTTIGIAQNKTAIVETITISGTVPRPETEFKPIDKTLAIWKNIGTVVSIADPRFTPENYYDGLWRPIDFLKQAEGGVFFLQEYNDNKVPVLLVHGINNGPTLWTQVIDSFSEEDFQPWVLYYPSGLRLDMISDYLVETVSQLQYKFGFSEFHVVGHSMGGLVTRSFVKKYVERNPENLKKLGLVVTVNSPMAGIASAKTGVNLSPIVVPSWRDLAPGSDFLQAINDWNWPDEIPYHLVISYLDGDSGDGVVPLKSQAQWKLQTEATRIYVFNEEHTRIINNKEFHTMLNTILKK